MPTFLTACQLCIIISNCSKKIPSKIFVPSNGRRRISARSHRKSLGTRPGVFNAVQVLLLSSLLCTPYSTIYRKISYSSQASTMATGSFYCQCNQCNKLWNIRQLRRNITLLHEDASDQPIICFSLCFSSFPPNITLTPFIARVRISISDSPKCLAMSVYSFDSGLPNTPTSSV